MWGAIRTHGDGPYTGMPPVRCQGVGERETAAWDRLRGFWKGVLMVKYGVNETNPLPGGYHDRDRGVISWFDLKPTDRIELERLRLLTDPGLPFLDISYMHLIVNGKRYRVTNLPFSQLGRKTYKRELVDAARARGLFIRNLTDPGLISILY